MFCTSTIHVSGRRNLMCTENSHSYFDPHLPAIHNCLRPTPAAVVQHQNIIKQHVSRSRDMNLYKHLMHNNSKVPWAHYWIALSIRKILTFANYVFLPDLPSSSMAAVPSGRIETGCRIVQPPRRYRLGSNLFRTQQQGTRGRRRDCQGVSCSSELVFDSAWVGCNFSFDTSWHSIDTWLWDLFGASSLWEYQHYWRW